MTRDEEIVEELLAALSTRGVGHTTAMRRGADASECHVVVGAEVAGMAILGAHRHKAISLAQVAAGYLRGYTGPVLIDHHALCLVLGPLLTKVARQRDMVTRLEKRLADIRRMAE